MEYAAKRYIIVMLNIIKINPQARLEMVKSFRSTIQKLEKPVEKH